MRTRHHYAATASQEGWTKIKSFKSDLVLILGLAIKTFNVTIALNASNYIYYQVSHLYVQRKVECFF